MRFAWLAIVAVLAATPQSALAQAAPRGTPSPAASPVVSPLPATAASASPVPSAPVYARALDLRAALTYALDHNPTVLARRATLAQDEANYARAHAAEFPTLAGSLSNQLARAQNTSGSLGAYGLSQQNLFSQNTAQISSQWNLFNGSLAQIQAQQNRRQAEAARNDLTRAEQQLAVDVTNAYYTLIARRDSVRLAEGDRAYQNRLVAAARASERVGRVAGVDVLRAEVNALRSEATLVSARADEQNARENLATTINAPAQTPFVVPETVPEPALPATPVDRLVSLAESVRPDVAAAQANLAVARLTNSAIDTDRLPQLTLSGSFGNQTIPTNFVSEQKAIDQQNAIRRQLGQPLLPGVVRGTPGFWQIGATETLTLPFIEYGARRAAHRSAYAGIASAQAALTAARTAVEVDVRQSLRQAQTAETNLGTAKRAADLGRESARIAQLQYRNGLISLTDATQAQQSALQAATDLVSARVTYVVAFVRFRASLGTYTPTETIEFGGAP